MESVLSSLTGVTSEQPIRSASEPASSSSAAAGAVTLVQNSVLTSAGAMPGSSLVLNFPSTTSKPPAEINRYNCAQQLRGEQNAVIESRVLRGIVFDKQLFSGESTPRHFINCTFIHCVLADSASLPEGSTFTDCHFILESPHAGIMPGFCFKDFSQSWINTTIDGGLKGFQRHSCVANLSGINISGGGLSNIIFEDSNEMGMVNTSFCGGRLENVTFSGRKYPHGKFYELSHVDLTESKSVNLTLVNIRCENVKLAGASIEGLVLSKNVDLSGVDFGEYQQGSIKISREMVSTPELIENNLNSLKDLRKGAYFFNMLKTILHPLVRKELFEQMVIILRSTPRIMTLLQNRHQLRESISKELKAFSYSRSEILSDFLQRLQSWQPLVNASAMVEGLRQNTGFPVSNQLSEINGESFVDHLLYEKERQTTPRTYRRVNFNKSLFLQLKKPVEFNGDIFIDCCFENVIGTEQEQSIINRSPVNFVNVTFYGYTFAAFASLPEGSEFINCSFVKIRPGRGSILRRLSFGKLSQNWVRTKIDGAHFSNQVSLSGIDMNHGVLNNITFNEDNGRLENSNFSESEWNNVTFIGSANPLSSLYEIRQVNMSNMTICRFNLNNVIFKDVDFERIVIKDLMLVGIVDFNYAEFKNYRWRNITLSSDNFHTPLKINENLNCFNDIQAGANLFKNMDTIGNIEVKLDLAEQVVEYCSDKWQLAYEIEKRPILNLALIDGLKNYAPDSEKIKAFVNDCLLNLKDIILPKPVPVYSELYQYLASLMKGNHAIWKNRLEYQFLAHQLMAEDTALKALWYQNKLMSRIIGDASVIFNRNINTLLEDHVFYHPDKQRTLIIPATEFRQLIRHHKVPQSFSHFIYDDNGEAKILATNQNEIVNTLNAFPALAKLWFSTGDDLAPVVETMLSTEIELKEKEKERLDKIKQHLISLLNGTATRKKRLSDPLNMKILEKVLPHFYTGDNAATSRLMLINTMQAQMAGILTHRELTDEQQKSIVSLVLVRVLVEICSSYRCASEYGPLYPLQRLAAELITDSQSWWPELVSESDAAQWRSVLNPAEWTMFNNANKVMLEMAEFKPAEAAGEKGSHMAGLIQQLYPL